MPDVAAARVTPIIMRPSKIAVRSARVWRSPDCARANYQAQPPLVEWRRGKKRGAQQNEFHSQPQEGSQAFSSKEGWVEGDGVLTCALVFWPFWLDSFWLVFFVSRSWGPSKRYARWRLQMRGWWDTLANVNVIVRARTVNVYVYICINVCVCICTIFIAVGRCSCVYVDVGSWISQK